MLAAVRRHWPEYLIEAGCLGLFMVAACAFATLLEHPGSPLRQAIGDPLLRRIPMGLAMGLTAVALIYSRPGRRSGAHMNPAVTLTYWRLGTVAGPDAVGYVAGQLLGGLAGVALAHAVLGAWLGHPAVAYAATVPGRWGAGAAFVAETVIAFVLMSVILRVSNHPRMAGLTGLAAGALVAAYIVVEAPVSGMSMNPARTLGSAVPAGVFTGLWIYFTAPLLGMLLAADAYRRRAGRPAVRCAKLHHDARSRCIFRCGYTPRPAAPAGDGSGSPALRPVAALAAALLLGGCTAGPAPFPDLGGLYNRAAQAGDRYRNPVIVIPGILGSRLRDRESGRLVWGAFGGTYADPGRPDGARLVALPLAEGRPLDDLRDEVVPDGALDRVRVRLLGLPLEQHAYLYVLRALGVGGYRDESLGRSGQIDYGPGHFTCFQFDYDWRRDNVENARRLHEFILAKRAYVAAELTRRFGVPEPEVRFDIVAHSMGGLLTRYYLQYGPADLPADGSPPPVTWAGAALVDRAVLVATPNAGSALALEQLVNGAKLAFILPRYPAAVLGTMPAVYQLLPRSRHAAVVEAPAGPDRASAPSASVAPGGDQRPAPVDVYDPAVWERYRWGLSDPAQAGVLATLLPGVPDPEARRRIAGDHLRKVLARARQFHAALDVPARPPPGLSLHLFAGDAIATPAVMAVDPATGRLSVKERSPGDGTVTRASALLDERQGRDWRPGVVSPVAWSDVTFLFSDHLALTRDPAFTDNILFRLLEVTR